MLEVLEKIIWVLTVLVIVGLAVGIYFVGGPSRYHLAEMNQPIKITSGRTQAEIDKEIKFEYDKEVEKWKKDKGEGAATYRTGKGGVKIPEQITDKETGLIKYVAPIHGRGTNPTKRYLVLDKRLKEKYSHFQDVYQIALLAESVFTEDDQGLPVVEVTHVTQGSIIEQVGFRKGDIVYSICGYTVRNEKEAMDLYDELKKRDIFSVELFRKKTGQRMTLNFRFD
ncbi:MAG: hypothetical protein E3J72_22790 [Planctomycetota bacterium]|nr:MAG: hypothetical protein E3J72_22790 [Planctomycetota bacterium]